MTHQEERMALNEARFREANERVGATARRLGMDQPIPFICECGRSDCMTIVRLLPRDYERIRSVATHFLYAHGHEEGMSHSRPVESLDGGVIVEKLDGPARVAVETDPRSAPATG
jgi:hypothetical protein